MKKLLPLLIMTIILIFNSLLAQKEITNKIKETKETQIINDTKATGDDVKIKDEEGNTLIRVIDEGTFGSMELQNGVPASTANKLYNDNGTLNFNGTALGTAGSLGGWTRTGTNVHLTNIGDLVGIGTTNPNAKLDVLLSGSVAWQRGIRLLNPDLGVGDRLLITLGAFDNSKNVGNIYFNYQGDGSLQNRLSLGLYDVRDVLNIMADGNVGIGTTTPSEILEVAGTVHSTAGGFKFPDGTVQATASTGGGKWEGESDIYYNDGRVGIGNNTPTYPLDVAGKIGIRNTQMIYLPDQTEFEGSVFYSTGGTNLGGNPYENGVGGNFNTALGIDALFNNIDGYKNTAVGYQSLFMNEGHYISDGYGNENTALGYQSLYENNGERNTAIGTQALYHNVLGTNNTAVGYHALFSYNSHYDGSFYNLDGNTAIGSNALYSNTQGHSNTAIGYRALFSNIDSDENTVIGYMAGESSGDSYQNTIIGCRAYRHGSGSNNVIIGYEAGSQDQMTYAGRNNVLIGHRAGWGMETGESNKLYIQQNGWGAPIIYGEFDNHLVRIDQILEVGVAEKLAASISFNGALFTGGNGTIPVEGEGKRMMWYSLKSAFRAGYVSDTQWDDVNIGDYSFATGNNTIASGEGSTAMGVQTTASGDYSTAMGALTTASGENSTAMGAATTASGYSSTAMGRDIEANGDYTVAIALSDQDGLAVTQSNTMAIMGGSVGIGTINPDYKLHTVIKSASEVAMFENQYQGTDSDGIIIKAGPDSNPDTGIDFIIFHDGDGDNVGTIDGNGTGGVRYNTTSDARLKTKIRDYTGASKTISKIKVRKYEKISAPGIERIGMIAQELQKVYPQAVSGSPDSDVNEDPMMIDYGRITPLLIRAIQELQAENQKLKVEMREFKRELGVQTFSKVSN